MNRIRNAGIYTRVIFCFTAILLVILLAVWIIVDTVCVNFIKKQRIQYNTQMIEKVSYEFDNIYFQMNQLLNSLNNAKSYGSNLNDQGEQGVYERLKDELKFEESIKSIMYSYDYQGFVEGILFYYGNGDYYYVGQSVTSPYYNFQIEEYESLPKDSTYGILGPMTVQKAGGESSSVLRFVLRPGQEWGVREGEQGAFVMVEVTMDKLEERLNQVLSPDNVYCLLNENDYSIISRGGDNKSLEEKLMNLFPEVEKRAGGENTTFTADDVLITSIELQKFGWILAVADSENILFQDISRLTLKVELLIGFCGIIGILAAVITSGKLFFPIRLLKKITAEIGEDREITVDSAKDKEVSEVIELLKQMKERIQELNARQYILEMREQEAQIQILQAQINPHFLHNTLDNIYCIAQIEEIEPIICLTKNLSNMMRYSVDNRQMFAALHEELEHVKCYVDILNIRFEDAISLHVEIAPELLKARVVKLLLQPVVENACVHGILPKESRKGNIWIRAQKEADDLILSVEDDGNGIDLEVCEKLNAVLQKKVKSARTPKNKGFGIALVNVNDRIRLLDGENYGLTIQERSDGGCRVVIQQKFCTDDSERRKSV